MSGPYRVLLVSDSYPPMIGGADMAVQSLATELHARGHTVAVATAWQPGLPEHETRDRIEVHRLRDLTSRIPAVADDPTRHVPPPFPDPEAVARIRRLVRRFRPDVIHSYGWLTYSCAPALASGRVPLVLSLHDYGNFCALRTLLHMDREPCSGPAPSKCLRCAATHYGPAKGAAAVAGVLGGRRPLARRAAGIQSNSEYMRQSAWRHLLRGRARLTPGSAADALLPPFHVRLEDGVPDRAILERLPREYILFVGALRRVKGVHDLLDAYAMLAAPPPLVLMGTREIDSPRHVPPGVTVVESVPHPTVMAAWDRALFGVFPSRGPEPFGLTVEEAMTHGRAVIGTTPGGHAEKIVDGETGLLVPAGRVEELAGAMERLIGDPALRDRLGEAARERMRLFTPEEWIPRLEALYESALAGSRGAGA
jgi:glycosyltransferase involved in cell wall biosynthesis